jgi:hypothetical protein
VCQHLAVVHSKVGRSKLGCGHQPLFLPSKRAVALDEQRLLHDDPAAARIHQGPAPRPKAVLGSHRARNSLTTVESRAAEACGPPSEHARQAKSCCSSRFALPGRKGRKLASSVLLSGRRTRCSRRASCRVRSGSIRTALRTHGPELEVPPQLVVVALRSLADSTHQAQRGLFSSTALRYHVRVSPFNRGRSKDETLSLSPGSRPFARRCASAYRAGTEARRLGTAGAGPASSGQPALASKPRQSTLRCLEPNIYVQ